MEKELSIKLSELVEELIAFSVEKLNLKQEDIIYTRNLLLNDLNLQNPAEPTTEFRNISDILEDIVKYAIKAKLTTRKEAILFETALMKNIVPLPSKIIENFDITAAEYGIEKSCTDLFEYCKNSNYIRTKDIAKNVKWQTVGEKGKIEITINLSKPEKDPKDILKAKQQSSENKYPQCMLCAENEGFAGSLTHPARQTLRIIPLELNDEKWNFQFSPYRYFDQHCIVFANEHRPMHVDISAYKSMLDFIELFPHYFIGSNAALPIVGGSILSHDHYQGGKKCLPMFERPNAKCFNIKKYPDVKIGIVDWYNSVIRISSKNRKQLEDCVNFIHSNWSKYSDKTIDLIAKDVEPHNAITPVCLINKDGEEEINLILRNNRTDEKHPYGIFHPAENLHNIKKEGIGIIEVMGLFILPGRLLKEMKTVKDYLTGKTPYSFEELANEKHPMHKHLGMIAQLANDTADITDKKVIETKITDYINNACQEILYTTAVFKKDEKGQIAFEKFMTKLGATKID